MCYGCWTELGKPSMLFHRKEQVIEAIKNVYKSSLVGGNMHVQLHDWNLGDEFFEKEELEIFTNSSDVEADRKCYALMQPIAEDERASALAAFEEFY